MSHTANESNDSFPHSAPIPISTHHSRNRSDSVSSENSSSPASPPQLQTPLNANPPRIPMASPSTSPILSYFLSQSPTKSPVTFPFKRGFAPVFEEESQEELPMTAHARRASVVATPGRYPYQPAPEHERGVGLLRRLSLGGTFSRPTVMPTEAPVSRSPPIPAPPPNSAVSPHGDGIPDIAARSTKVRRATTLNERPRRAPSPMGERILKGHFDGFN